MKKKVFVVIACVLLVVLVMGVWGMFGSGNEEVVTDAECYLDKEKFQGNSGLKVFPDQIDVEGTEKYYYSYQDKFLDSSAQIYLRCVYSEEEFQKELDRLSQASLSHEGEVHMLQYNTTNYKAPAYEAIRAADHCYEYALLDESEGIIEYIFLQFTPEKEIVFDQSSLPDGYEKDEKNPYNIYAFPKQQFDEGKGYEPVYH